MAISRKAIEKRGERRGPELELPTLTQVPGLPPGLPVFGLPVLWVPVIVFAKVSNLMGWLYVPQERCVGRRTQANKLARPIVEQLFGMTSVVLQNRDRWRAPCPTCHRLMQDYWLHAGRWECRCCHRVPDHMQGLPRQLARYQFGLLLGAGGRSMKVQRALTQRWVVKVAARAHTVWDLWTLSVAGLMLEVDPQWCLERIKRPRGLPRAQEYAPLWEHVKPWIVEAVIDELLAPDAYKHRYYRWLTQVEAAA